MMRASVVVVGVFFGGEVGGKVYFFEKKCVFGVDKGEENGYIALALGPQLACTARASKDVDRKGGHFFCLNFQQLGDIRVHAGGFTPMGQAFLGALRRRICTGASVARTGTRVR